MLLGLAARDFARDMTGRAAERPQSPTDQLTQVQSRKIRRYFGIRTRCVMGAFWLAWLGLFFYIRVAGGTI
ncbi:hypothetical protein [Streptomyces cellostaticus]|uniref:hypothetical protein n=1 Tax=Streptomyces cellostaticus TaxID=67285 RepID=UPI002025FB01|nr:hypothetical protein [Streptomyces cellostaticus]